MKIHILNKTTEKAWGGGNQFLKALKKQFLSFGIYENNVLGADIVLYDSYQCLEKAVYLKNRHPEKIFIHRLGPVFSTYRGKHWRVVDKSMAEVANKIADVVIPQSNWTCQNFIKLGLDKNKKYLVINNTVDLEIFNTKFRAGGNSYDKIKLVTDSWSSNWNKGFKFYKYLDENLDFDRYEMTFIGNSPIEFKNIHHIKPLKSLELSKELQKHDIFISGVKDDACSNSIIEALACGLPVVALDSGGNSELVGKAGELFTNTDDLIFNINKVSSDLIKYRDLIKIEDIGVVAKKYASSIEASSITKKVSLLFFIRLSVRLFLFRFLDKIISFFKKYVK